MTHPDTRTAPDLVCDAAPMLETQRVGRAVRTFKTVTSTNTLAAQWAEEGAPDGAIVYAEGQTQGRGRMGRTWHARAGLNLTFSVILRPDWPCERVGMISAAAGLAVAEAVDEFASPLRATIKWPNDVLLNERKCCGILLESRWTAANRVHAVVLGIGLNVNQDSFPAEIEHRATSLLLELGRPVPRADLYAALLARLELRLDDLARDPDEIRRLYLDRMAQMNAPVSLRFAGGGMISGVATGIDESGGLILETDRGRQVYHAGEVTSGV